MLLIPKITYFKSKFILLIRSVTQTKNKVLKITVIYKSIYSKPTKHISHEHE